MCVQGSVVTSCASPMFSAVMFIFCFSFFGLGGGAVGDRGMFSNCSSVFSMIMMMMMMMFICDIACYIYFNFIIEYINIK